MKSKAQGGARVRLIGFASTVALVGAAAACAAQVDQKAPEPQEPASQELRAPAGRHFKGPVAVVIEAARTHGNLSADQAGTLDTIAAELEAEHGSHKALHEKLRTTAVAVVRSGTADTKEFQASVDEAALAIEERIGRRVDALEEIHATLEPSQRARVAAALRAKLEERFGRKREGEPRRAEGFRRFAAHLVLSNVQIDQLQALQKDLFGEREQLHPSRDELFALVDAFEGENFSAALDDLREKKSKVLRAKVATAGKRTDTVLSIFTPEQREILAELILDGPRKVLLGDEPAVRGQP